MQAQTQSFYYEIRRRRSVILNRNNMDKRTSAQLFLTEDGIRHMLNQYTTKDVGRNGEILGELDIAKHYYKLALEDWERHKEANAFESDKPYSNFEDKLNETSAYVEVVKDEIKEMKKIIAEIDSKKAKEEQSVKAIAKKKRQGIGKYKNGVIVLMDGRDVKNDKFIDDGMTVREYIDIIKAEKREKSKRMREKEKGLACNC